ncbi:DUF4291 domain-containing protein [Clostridium beijerinckii]|uniref:DUF4291 domain-containing protein n=1 Tax=Clostridium beijerinckii TaxID=1520 RepID=UPI001494E1D5|nr:DUF4291 domain-containing protein [Clostridium beijerinckii]NOW06154.1 hypothetical protein [Clostridium beijerinckii]NYC00702.1 hypothetical protein [Clostridium beijerinckii]
MNQVYKKEIINEDRRIFATYDETTIRIYQAYNKRIANEALELGRFGKSFKVDRMTWIKPSFLWMMYRSGWGTKVDQERVLAIDIMQEGFEKIIQNAVLSTYNERVYSTYNEWKDKLSASQVRCQWDPDRDIYGNAIERRAIQLGIKGLMVNKYVNEWIKKITDITEDVAMLREARNNKTIDSKALPDEKEYFVDDNIKDILGMR